MQMSCIIYECQCLSKSVSHNLQSESERHGEGSSSKPNAKEALCIFLQVLPGNIVKCYLKEIKVPNIHERQRFSSHSLHPNSLPKNLQVTNRLWSINFWIHFRGKKVNWAKLAICVWIFLPKARNVLEKQTLYPFVWIFEGSKMGFLIGWFCVCPAVHNIL